MLQAAYFINQSFEQHVVLMAENEEMEDAAEEDRTGVLKPFSYFSQTLLAWRALARTILVKQFYDKAKINKPEYRTMH